MESVNKLWVMLEFFMLGFIGKFFKLNDVEKLVSFL